MIKLLVVILSKSGIPMEDFTTPMMKQYVDIKKKYQDCLLFFRMGDFYELFLEDAHIGAEVLDIALTSRAKGKDGRVPMAGVPYHAVDSYLAKLVKAGYKVAICEQMTEPNARGIVDREVIRIVTPGTVLDEKTLRRKEHNYILSIVKKNHIYGLAVADISTGFFQISEIDEDDINVLTDECARLNPSECILPDDLYNQIHFLKKLRRHTEVNIYCFQNSLAYIQQAKKIVEAQFGKQISVDPQMRNMSAALHSASMLIGYLQYTQKNMLPHCKTISILSGNQYLILDRSTMMNLELFSTLRDMERKGTISHLLDQTSTAMGGRLLRDWMKRPLIEPKEISCRHDAVEELLRKTKLRETLKIKLEEIADVERIISRLSVNIGNARDLVTLCISIEHMQDVKNIIKDCSARLINEVSATIDKKLEEVVRIIKTNIVDTPPFDTKIGNMIQPGIHQELDEIRKVLNDNKSWLIDFEKEEQQKTGIGSLKVRFNKVFGFYIEISKANAVHAPSRYMRKQTLVNGERFITEELKKREEIILTGEARMQDIEYELFCKILKQVLTYIESIQKSAEAIATLDCLVDFAELSHLNHYIRPTLLQNGQINILGGRHPVVEHVLEDDQFVPNDTHLDNVGNQLLIITGPNMAGKSVYLRHVALISLMNQMGCFVPAQKAELSIIDRIFVRSGASDIISEGLSTFMVEMVETAQILNKATSKSLVIMDEIGRGTSTYDGISIAWAVAEFLVKNKKVQPKTLFATHYHELQDLEKKYPNKIKNFHMAVEEENGDPVFLYTILPGGASHSFGVAVAKLAGLPEEVITAAWGILASLEKRDPHAQKQKLVAPKEKNKIVERLKEIKVDELTPLEALNMLADLKKLI